MPNSPAISQAALLKNIKKMSDKGLQDYETILTTRMGNIHKFCPWPALEESFAQDIAAIWREQKARTLSKDKGEMK